MAPAVRSALAALGPTEQTGVIVTLGQPCNLKAAPGLTRAARLAGLVRTLHR
jgi:hypothetical protein